MMRPRPKKARRTYTFEPNTTPPNISFLSRLLPDAQDSPLQNLAIQDSDDELTTDLSPFAMIPDELILRITDFLDPLLIVDGRKLHSSAYIDPGRDLIAFANTCRYMKGLLRKVLARTEDVGHYWRDLTDGEATDRRLGHAFVDLTQGPSPRVSVLVDLAPRLGSFAVVYRTEEQAVARSPYDVMELPSILPLALSRSKVKHVFFCGVYIGPLVTGVGATFPFESLILRGVAGNHAFDFLSRCPELKRLELWRDFMITPGVGAGFWPDHLWGTLREIDLKGISGERGRDLYNLWTGSLIDLRKTSPTLNIPLHTLRLFEPYRLPAIQRLLEAIGHLPHLKSISIIVWRDGFSASLIEEIAAALPALEHLELAVESESLFWWSSNLTKLAHSIGQFKHLKSLTWNHQSYQTITIPSHSRQFKSDARIIASHSSSLLKICWVNEEQYVYRETTSDAWKWSGVGIQDESISPVILEEGSEKGSSGSRLLNMMMRSASTDDVALGEGEKTEEDSWGSFD